MTLRAEKSLKGDVVEMAEASGFHSERLFGREKYERG